MSSDTDQQLAERFGRYASFRTETAPITDYYGEEPAQEVNRLLDIHARADTCFLDVGCGAGHTIARIAPKVKDVWGIDVEPDLLNGARQRVKDLGLTNVTLVEGNASIVTDTDKLPDDHFDLALSQRGPDFNHWLVSKLKDGAFVIQELVAPFSCYPLREIFGRTNYAPYNYKGRDVLLHKYAEWGLFPVSVKEYFYEEFYRDVHHFEADLRKSTANLTDWHVGTPRPYEAARDRVALELYARYNTTPRGIRMLQHRMIFVLRRTTVAYYPVDGLSSNKECRQNE